MTEKLTLNDLFALFGRGPDDTRLGRLGRLGRVPNGSSGTWSSAPTEPILTPTVVAGAGLAQIGSALVTVQ